MIDFTKYREMGVRSWVGYAISEGNTIEWGLGWAVKVVAELALAILIGSIIYAASLGFTPAGDLAEVFGTKSRITVWALIVAGFYKLQIMCEFDRHDDSQT